MAVRQLPNGKYEIRYPSHRSAKGKISYRFKVVGYSKRVAIEAERKLYTDFKNREIHGVPHEPDKPKEWTAEELLDWYLELPDVKKKKSYSDDVIRATTLKAYFGDAKADKLVPGDIKDYRNHRLKQNVAGNGYVSERTISNATVNKEVGLLKACLNEALADQKVSQNACKGVKALKEKERDRTCSLVEFELLKQALHQEARDIITILYYTGMRYGEVVGLSVDRVDRTTRTVLLRAEHTKNGEPRKVPFMSLEVHEVFERRCSNRIYGKVFSIKSIKKAFKNACEKLGIEDLRLHDFRHTAATNMRKAGVDTATVMKICGWKSVAMFIRYNNVDDRDLGEAAKAVAGWSQDSKKSLTPISISA